MTTRTDGMDRKARGLQLIDTVRQDVRYALRTMRKSPGFSTVVILSLALGIGANTAIFSLINALMLRPLPVREPERLVEVLTNVPSEPRIIGLMNGFPWEVYAHYRDQNHVFSDLIGVSPARLHANAPGLDTEVVDAEYVTGNFFSALGVQPLAGRLIGPREDELGSPDAAVAVLSWSYWKSRFNLDPTIVGKRITVEGVPAVVIGVAPRRFFGLQVGTQPDMWLPTSMEAMIQRPSHRADGTLNLKLMGRLKPGASIEQARAEMRVLDQVRIAFYSRRSKPAWISQVAIYVIPGGAGLSAVRLWFARPLFGLMAVVGLLLLIACLNVAMLLLARGAARRRELAVRVSLGAGRGRLLRQLLTESLLLSALGCVPGIVLAYVAADALSRLLTGGLRPPGLPQRIDIQVQPDLHVLVFTAGVALLTALLFGLASAWNAFGASASALREIGDASDTRSRRLFGKILVVAQVALSVVLLSAAALFVRHLSDLRNVGLGFDRESVLLVRLDRSHSGYQANQLAHLNRQLLDRLAAIPGVRSATLSGLTPIEGPGAARRVIVEGVHESLQDRPFIPLNSIAPKYFETFGTPLIAGRDFAFEDEGHPPVAIINHAMARRYFGNANPVGRHFTSEVEGGPYEIVGVVADAKYNDLHEAAPETIYLNAFQEGAGRFAQFAVRTTVAPAAVAGAVRSVVRDVLKTVQVARMTTLTEQMDASLSPERFIATLSGLFGALGAMLAAIGLYGLLAYTVTRRVTEIGIRMALGATQGDVMGMVLRAAFGLVCAGLAIGIPIATWGRRAAASMLNSPPAEAALIPIVIGAAAMIALALLAAYVPARRASRVHPMDALRQ